MIQEAPLRLPRFRLRTLMIAVALAAMVLALGVMRRRQADLRRRAAYHAEAERSYRACLDDFLGRVAGYERSNRPGRRAAAVRAPGIRIGLPLLEDPDQLPLYRACAARYGAATAYHSAMRTKYELAASRPWRSVQPDPPAPE